MEEIEKSKQTTLPRFLYALGIPLVGEHLAQVLAEHFGSLEALMAADEASLTEIREIGPQVSQSLRTFFGNPQNREVIRRLREAGIRWKPPGGTGDLPLSGEVFVFTGALPDMTRDEAKKLVERLGAQTANQVSKKTTCVVAGEKAGSKLEKARTLGIKILTPEAFLSIIRKYGGE